MNNTCNSIILSDYLTLDGSVQKSFTLNNFSGSFLFNPKIIYQTFDESRKELTDELATELKLTASKLFSDEKFICPWVSHNGSTYGEIKDISDSIHEAIHAKSFWKSYNFLDQDRPMGINVIMGVYDGIIALATPAFLMVQEWRGAIVLAAIGGSMDAVRQISVHKDKNALKDIKLPMLSYDIFHTNLKNAEVIPMFVPEAAERVNVIKKIPPIKQYVGSQASLDAAYSAVNSDLEKIYAKQRV